MGLATVSNAWYTAEYGIAAALQHCKAKQGLELKEGTVRGWKMTFCNELASQKRKGNMKPVDLCILWDVHWYWDTMRKEQFCCDRNHHRNIA